MDILAGGCCCRETACQQVCDILRCMKDSNELRRSFFDSVDKQKGMNYPESYVVFAKIGAARSYIRMIGNEMKRRDD